jgi:predicted ribosome quality control (RQC) complex YloA/Tae2 family protein
VSNTIRYDSLLVRQLARELNAELAGGELRSLWLERARQRVALVLGDRALVWDLRSGGVAWQDAVQGENEIPLPRHPVIAGIEALSDERILRLAWRGGRRQNAAHALLIELLPNASNAIALDERGCVLKSLAPKSGSRVQTRGQPYQPPQALHRLGAEHPLEFDEWAELLRSEPASDWASRLTERVAYVSGINVHAICPAGAEHPEESYRRYRELTTQESRPVVLSSGQPYCHPLWQTDADAQSTLLQAISTAAAAQQNAAGAADRLERALARERKKIERLRSELDSAAVDAQRLRTDADLLLASANAVKRGAASIELTGFDGKTVRLTLDPARSAADNAQEWYAEARKRERASERLPALIAQAEAALAKLTDDVKRVQAGEAIPASEPAKAPPKPQQRGPRLPYRTYRTSGGLEVRVGRSSRENDELTLRHSAPNDIWMHARAVGGAHVVLRWNDASANPPKQDMTEAAIIAAVHSRARHAGTVPIDWTRKKYVRKHRGSPPGQVTIERAKTIFVQPNAAVEEKLRASHES